MCPQVRVKGTFLRHASLKQTGLSGHPVGGRWAPSGAFPVLYLGRPLASVVVEAYRHLVDGVEGMTGDLVGPRRLLVCEVDLGDIVDLRNEEDRERVGLSAAHITSEVGDYERCQRVGARAHQLGRKGIIAPAATGLGETLALFTTHIGTAEMPTLMDEELWDVLPRDPRALRLVEDEASGS